MLAGVQGLFAIVALAVSLSHHHKPHVWHAPKWWLRQAVCIHQHEGAWNDQGALYGGGMQVLVSTWNAQGAGGEVPYARTTADIGRQTPRIQLHAAYRIWLRSGRSWHQWGTAGMCGLT